MLVNNKHAAKSHIDPRTPHKSRGHSSKVVRPLPSKALAAAPEGAFTPVPSHLGWTCKGERPDKKQFSDHSVQGLSNRQKAHLC